MEVKRIPDPDPIVLSDFLPYQVTRLADRIARRTAAVAKAHDGLNISHWRVLAAVAEAPGRTANAVVAVTPMDKGIVSRAVKTLIDLRLLTRKASTEDGRLAHLFLTARGARAYASMATEVRAIDDALSASLSGAEKRAFLATLEKLLACA
ncbi:MAG: MarR family winged helix-turn-helix transcriptional regulator [Pseudomonadota bacterium]